jgi:hypothetical protein
MQSGADAVTGFLASVKPGKDVPGSPDGGCLSCAGRQFHFRELNMCSQPDVAVAQGHAGCGSVQVDECRFHSARRARHNFQPGNEKRPESLHAAGWFSPRQVTRRDPAVGFPVARAADQGSCVSKRSSRKQAWVKQALIVEAGDGAQDRFIIGSARQIPLPVAFTGERSLLLMRGHRQW